MVQTVKGEQRSLNGEQLRTIASTLTQLNKLSDAAQSETKGAVVALPDELEIKDADDKVLATVVRRGTEWFLAVVVAE